MARLLVCAFATLALFTTSASALVGSHHLGNSVSQDRDEYLMCGKCTWDPKSGQSAQGTSATDVQGYYQLDCPSGVTSGNTTQWGTLKYNCAQGCVTCASSTSIVIGKKIEGSYKKDAIVFPMIAASVQCCPEIVERTYWSQDGCVGTSKSEFQPAGCRWDDVFDNFEQFQCGDDGDAPEHWKSGCTAGTLNHGDDCPADPSCLTEYEPVNRPCVKVGFAGQTTPAGYDKQSLTCHKNGNQKCIRAVREAYYQSSMTPADDGTLATLTCTDLYNGVGDFRQTAVAVLLAVAGFVAMLA